MAVGAGTARQTAGKEVAPQAVALVGSFAPYSMAKAVMTQTARRKPARKPIPVHVAVPHLPPHLPPHLRAAAAC